MTKLLSRSCRPLTYLLTFLLLPLVLIVSTSNTASAAVVGVGPTVTATFAKDDLFPGEEVSCSITGYTRLHDTGLYSVRAVVNCAFGFGMSDFTDFTLVARDADTSTSNDCRFENIGTPIVEGTDTETTLTANLHPDTPPQADCNLTSADITLTAPPGYSFDRDDVTGTVAWPLGALPVADEQSVADGSCPGEFTMSAPVVHEPFVWQPDAARYEPDPTPAQDRRNRRWVQKVTFTVTRPTGPAPVGRRVNVAVIGQGVTASKTRTQLQADGQALYGGNYSAGLDLYGATEVLDLPNSGTDYVNGNGGNLFLTQYASGEGSSGFTTLPAADSSAWNAPVSVTFWYFTSFVQSPSVAGQTQPPPQNMRVLGVQLQTEATTSTTLRPDGRHSGYNRVGEGGLCWIYFGEQIRSDDFYGAGSSTPVGPLSSSGPPAPVEEPPTIDNPAPGPTEGGCDGFSFTDPSSWAGAGICVLVKAVRALFRVMSDVLGVLSGMVSGIVSGILNGLSALFVPSDESLEGMKDALDFTDHENLAGWTDTLTTDGLLGQGSSGASGSSGPAMRQTGEMNTLSSTPSIVPGVVLTGSCQGPGIAADKLAVLGYEGTLHPFAACDGTMATVAQWTRLLLMMFVGLSAALKVFQMLAVGVGAARSAHILGSFDWSEATRR